MSKHAFGLDISDSSIEAVEIKKKFGKLNISAYGRIELEPGVVANGKINNKDILIEHLGKIEKSGQFSTKNCVISVPESKTFIHIFNLPSVISFQNIGESVQYAAEEQIPLSFDKAYHDYQILAKEEDHQEVLYIASFKDIVDDYREVLTRAGLNPLVFETESLSLARSLVRDDVFEGVLIVDIGVRTTILTIFDHRGIRFSENVGLAGEKFTQKISRSLKISTEDAENAKIEIGLTQLTSKGKVSVALEPVVKKVVKEIKKTIDYYQKKTGFVVNKVVLCGGSSLMPGLFEYIKQAIVTRVEMGNPLQELRFNKKIFQADQSVLYATSVGLALRGADNESLQQGINLLSNEKEHKKFKSIKEPHQKHDKEKNEGEITPKQQKVKSPKPKSERKRLFILLAVFGVLLLAFAGIFLLQRDREEPLISFVDTEGMEFSDTTQAETTYLGLQSEVLFYIKDQDRKPDGAYNGRLIEKTNEKTSEFTATGTKMSDQASTATMTIINNYSTNQPLIATTRFLSGQGILFRLSDYTVAPAGSSVDAEVYADDPDQVKEIAPSKWTIPGLSQSLQEYIYGQTSATISGSGQEISYILETDIKAAEKSSEEPSSDVSLSDFSGDLLEGEALLPKAVTIEATEYTPSLAIGAEAEAFNMTAQVNVQALAYMDSDIAQLFNGILRDRVSSNASISDYKLQDWAYTIKGYDTENGIVTVLISCTAVAD